jgi:dCMP deaminase
MTKKMDYKRNDYINWDQYFMGIALLSAERSKDPSTQVGACIVGEDNRILSMGYNGMPQGCDDDDMPWGRDGAALDSKYIFVCHAELNAILNYSGSGANLRGAKIYTTLFPCNECTKALIQKRVGKIVYLDDKYHDTDTSEAARRMLDSAGVKYERYDLTGRDITISL